MAEVRMTGFCLTASVGGNCINNNKTCFNLPWIAASQPKNLVSMLETLSVTWRPSTLQIHKIREEAVNPCNILEFHYWGIGNIIFTIRAQHTCNILATGSFLKDNGVISFQWSISLKLWKPSYLQWEVKLKIFTHSHRHAPPISLIPYYTTLIIVIQVFSSTFPIYKKNKRR